MNSNRKPLTTKIQFPIDRGIGEVANTLRQSAVFATADRDLLMLVARLAEPIHIKQGKHLYKQGETAKSFAVITQGALSVSVRDGDRTKVVAVIQNGKTVGDMSIFNEEAKRSATVTASRATTVYEISNAAFKRVMMREPQLMTFMFNDLVQKVANGQKALVETGLLRLSTNRNLVDCLDPHALIKFGRLLKAKRVAKGKAIVGKGDVAKRLYLVDSGSITLKSDDGGSEALESGTYFDEIAFFAQDGCQRFSAEAGLDSDCGLLCLSRKQFHEFANKNPEILWSMAAELTKMIQSNNEKLKNTKSYALQLACEGDEEHKAYQILTSGQVNADAPCPLQDVLHFGARPLHVAAYHHSNKVFAVLASHGVDINAVDVDDNMPAHIAAKTGNLHALEIIHEYRGKLCLPNKIGETPLKLANDNGHRGVAEFLMSKGCKGNEDLLSSTSDSLIFNK